LQSNFFLKLLSQIYVSSEKSFEEETSSQSTDITNESFSDPDERRYEPDSSDVGNEVKEKSSG